MGLAAMFAQLATVAVAMLAIIWHQQRTILENCVTV